MLLSEQEASQPILNGKVLLLLPEYDYPMPPHHGDVRPRIRR